MRAEKETSQKQSDLSKYYWNYKGHVYTLHSKFHPVLTSFQNQWQLMLWVMIHEMTILCVLLKGCFTLRSFLTF